MFEGEALGLSAMYETNSIRVPKPFKVEIHLLFFFKCQNCSSNEVLNSGQLLLCYLKVGALPTGGSYIIMEFIEFGSSRGDQVDLIIHLFALQSLFNILF